MYRKIFVCGLNGAGKSTLGRALAADLGYQFMDIEDYYFPKTDPNYLYASPRTREEVEELLKIDVKTHKNCVLAAVKPDFSDEIQKQFDLAIYVKVPKKLRLERVKQRSFNKFGSRMQPGGDLYETEQEFFRSVAERPENLVDEWLKTLSCPIIEVDGTKSIAENIDILHKMLK